MRGRTSKKVLLIGKEGNLILDNKKVACNYLGVSKTTLQADINQGRMRKGYYVDFLMEGK